MTTEEGERYIAEVGEYFAALPADRFPNIVALAGPLVAGGGEGERFEFGLDVLVAGLAAYGRRASCSAGERQRRLGGEGEGRPGRWLRATGPVAANLHPLGRERPNPPPYMPAVGPAGAQITAGAPAPRSAR